MNSKYPLITSVEFRKLFDQTRTFAVEIPWKSWFHLLSTLALCASSILLASSSGLPMFVRLLASLITSLLYVRLFIMFHDFEHGAIFGDSILGKILMSGIGFFLLRAPYDWKRTHNYHHQNNMIFETASVGSFPVKTLKQYLALSPEERRRYRVVRHSLVLVFGYLTAFILETVKKFFYKDLILVTQSVFAFLLHLSFMWYCFSLGWEAGLLVGLIPHFIAGAVGIYLFYIQHAFEGADFLPDAEWDYGYAALYSSSYIEAGPIFNFFTANIGYHHVHHLNPKIPFYRLPEAMSAVSGLQNPVTVRITPRTVWRSLGFKLWDEVERRYRGYPARSC